MRLRGIWDMFGRLWVYQPGVPYSYRLAGLIRAADVCDRWEPKR